MTKQLSLAVLLLACLFIASCKDETCAKCELRLYCVTCDYGGAETELCDVDGTDSFESACVSAGGVLKSKSNTLQDTRELCNEDALVVNEFMDDKTADEYTCEYVD